MPIENISKAEQTLSMSVGARLLFFGIERIKTKPLPSVLQMLIGGFLIYRGYSGYCPANEVMNINTAGQTLYEAIDTYTNTAEPVKTVNTIQINNQP